MIELKRRRNFDFSRNIVAVFSGLGLSEVMDLLIRSLSKCLQRFDKYIDFVGQRRAELTFQVILDSFLFLHIFWKAVLEVVLVSLFDAELSRAKYY